MRRLYSETNGAGEFWLHSSVCGFDSLRVSACALPDHVLFRNSEWLGLITISSRISSSSVRTIIVHYILDFFVTQKQ